MRSEHIRILKELKKQNEKFKKIAATKLQDFKNTAMNCQNRNQNLTCKLLNPGVFCHPKECPFANKTKPYDVFTQDLHDKSDVANFYNTISSECLDFFNRTGLSCCEWATLINSVGKCSAKIQGIHKGIGPTCNYSICKYV